MTTALITQSNYIPWRGYFDLINNADTFAIFKLTYGHKPFNRLDTKTMEFTHG